MSFLLISLRAGAQNPSSEHQQEAVRFFKVSEYDSAAYHYEKAISLCKACSDTLHARLILRLFKIYMYGERIEEAYNQLTKAKNHAKKAKSDEYVTLAYVTFAEYFRSTRKYEKANIYLNKAHQVISKGKTSEATLALYYNRKAAILSVKDKVTIQKQLHIHLKVSKLPRN